MTPGESGLVQSVRAHLLTVATATRSDPNAILTRYGIERFLYRLSRSPHGDRFVLKGALLLVAWLGQHARATRDADVLGFGDLDPETLTALFRDVCALPCEVLADLPAALGEVFVNDPAKQAQWKGFCRKTLVEPSAGTLPTLAETAARVVRFIGPVLSAAHDGRVFVAAWKPGGPWRLADPSV